jgi:2-C-methyl-D-erythritol 4-phosphate cytidylyltransferase
MNSQGARCWAVVPAAGTGSRMGADVPKQYLQLAGATVLEHSVKALLACDRIEGVVVALHPADEHGQALAVLADERVRTVAGAQERSGSVLAGLHGLSAWAASGDWVLVHDAARPCLRAADIERLIDEVISSGVGGILAEPVVDTVKQAGNDRRVVATLDRSTLWRAQTPQMFRLGELRAALEEAARRGAPVTDEASAMELAGRPVQLVPGSRDNLKVTVAEDLALAAWYLAQR